MEYEWDFAGGEAEFRKALALDPNDATAHQWFAESLSVIGGRDAGSHLKSILLTCSIRLSAHCPPPYRGAFAHMLRRGGMMTQLRFAGGEVAGEKTRPLISPRLPGICVLGKAVPPEW